MTQACRIPSRPSGGRRRRTNRAVLARIRALRPRRRRKNKSHIAAQATVGLRTVQSRHIARVDKSPTTANKPPPKPESQAGKTSSAVSGRERKGKSINPVFAKTARKARRWQYRVPSETTGTIAGRQV